MTVYIQYACNKDKKYYSIVNICQTVQLKNVSSAFHCHLKQGHSDWWYIGIYTPKSVPENYFVH